MRVRVCARACIYMRNYREVRIHHLYNSSAQRHQNLVAITIIQFTVIRSLIQIINIITALPFRSLSVASFPPISHLLRSERSHAQARLLALLPSPSLPLPLLLPLPHCFSLHLFAFICLSIYWFNLLLFYLPPFPTWLASCHSFVAPFFFLVFLPPSLSLSKRSHITLPSTPSFCSPSVLAQPPSLLLPLSITHCQYVNNLPLYLLDFLLTRTNPFHSRSVEATL